MTINYNEVEQLNSILQDNKLIRNEWYTITLLAKHCSILKMNVEESFIFIEEHLKSIIPNCNILSYKDIIKKSLKIFLNKNNIKLSNVEKIIIYKEEVEFIESHLAKESYQKVAFTYLAYRKIRNEIYNRQDTIIPEKDKDNDIFKNANMTETGFKITKVIRKLIEANVLKIMGFYTDKKGNLKIDVTDNRVDVCNYIKFEGEIAFEVEAKDFENLGLVWLLHKGNKKIKRCQRCENLIQTKGKERTKYCKECAKVIKNEQNKNYYRENVI